MTYNYKYKILSEKRQGFFKGEYEVYFIIRETYLNDKLILTDVYSRYSNPSFKAYNAYYKIKIVFESIEDAKKVITEQKAFIYEQNRRMYEIDANTIYEE